MASLTEIVRSKKAKMEGVMRSSVLRLGNRIIQDSPVDTGRFINNWMSAVGTQDTSTRNDESMSGSQSSADLENMASELKPNQIGYFTNSLPYAEVLELGSSAKAPDGMVAVNVLNWQEIVDSETRAAR